MKALAKQRGAIYLALLMMIVLAATGSLKAFEIESTQLRRELELDLLSVGREMRVAIGMYYEASPGILKTYPSSLEMLLKDERFIGTQRFLRKVRRDPMTNAANWELIVSPQGGIQGVASRSEKVPIKKTGFVAEEGGFASAATYKDWRFVYQPSRAASPKSSGTGAAGPAEAKK